MVTVEFVTEHGNTIRFTVPDTVAFAIIDALKASGGVKTVTYRHWVERHDERPGA